MQSIYGEPEIEINAEFLEEVKRARKMWQDALSYYESVSDPDLVDFAIYDIEACRKRYVYLIKRAKEQMRVQTDQNKVIKKQMTTY